MKAIKKINNNVVLALNHKGEEVFVTGKGLGFIKMPYNLDEYPEKIEKIFVKKDNLKFEALFDTIPSEVILVTEEIISEGKKILQTELNDGLIVALSDHINVALDRQSDGLELSNAFQWELKHIYPTEIRVGFKALELIKKKLGIQLPESESSFIALHFVNGQYNTNEFTQTAKITKVIKDILSIVKYHYKFNLDEESINYARFVTHLRYFIIRLINNQALIHGNIELYEIVKQDASKELACIHKINKYLKDNENWNCTNDEKLYLILHLQRLTRNL